jgi:hypothetical protein
METKLLELIGEPLRGQADWLRRRHGLTESGAAVTALTAVLCAVGPSHCVLNPVDLTALPASASFVLVGTPVMHVQAAANVVLDPIRQWIHTRIAKDGKPGLRRVRLRIADLHEQLLQQEFLLRTTIPQPRPGIEPFLMAENERKERQAEVENTCREIRGRIKDELFRLTPMVMVDDAPIRHLMDPCALAHDGGVLAVSISGRAIRAWTQARRGEKAELARLLGNSWLGLHDAFPSTVSALVVTDPTGAKVMIGDADLTGTGVADELLFISALGSEPKTDILVELADDISEQWTTGLQAMIDARIAGSRVDHQLCPDALTRFQRFLNEDVKSPEFRGLERSPPTVLKMALLAHCATRRDEADIDTGTLEFAIALSEAVAASDTGSRAAPKEEVIDTDLDAIVAKLRLRGPLRWRQLLRSCHYHKAAPLIRVLEHGIATGRIRRDGDLYDVVEEEKTS